MEGYEKARNGYKRDTHRIREALKYRMAELSSREDEECFWSMVKQRPFSRNAHPLRTALSWSPEMEAQVEEMYQDLIKTPTKWDIIKREIEVMDNVETIMRRREENPPWGSTGAAIGPGEKWPRWIIEDEDIDRETVGIPKTGNPAGILQTDRIRLTLACRACIAMALQETYAGRWYKYQRLGIEYEVRINTDYVKYRPS